MRQPARNARGEANFTKALATRAGSNALSGPRSAHPFSLDSVAKQIESGRYWIRTPPENKVKTEGADESGAKCGALSSDSVPNPTLAKPDDPELAAVVAAWPDLPPAIRAGVLALVRAPAVNRPDEGPFIQANSFANYRIPAF